MHLDYNDRKNEYYICNDDKKVTLQEKEIEKDLGVIVDRQMNVHEHTSTAVKKKKKQFCPRNHKENLLMHGRR